MEFWIRRLHNQLIHQPVVKHVRFWFNRITVYYTTGFRRTYIFAPIYNRHRYKSKINKENGRISEPIKIGYQYQWQMMNRPDLANYFLVRRERVERATEMEQEILIHELLLKIQSIRLLPCYYTQEDQLSDLNRIKEITRCYSNGIITLFPNCGLGREKPGRVLIESHYDIDSLRRYEYRWRSTLNNASSQDRLLYVALQKLVKITKWDITFANLRKMLHRLGYGPTYVNPVVYKTIFHQMLKPAGRLLSDPTPALGSKAIACAILGARYHPMDTFPTALADSLDLQLDKPSGKHDILLLDNNFIRVDIEAAMTRRDECKEMVVYVENDQMEEAYRKYKPHQVFKIKTKPIIPKGSPPNYIFHFKN